jgi:ribosomal protein S24E
MALLGVDTAEEAFSHVNVLPVSAMDSPEWQGSFGSSSTAISEDGQIPESPNVIPGTEISNVKDLYGASERLPADVEEFAGNIIGAILTPARQKGDISEKVFKENLENLAQLAKYINAFLYGGYNIPENIYADLKAKTLAEQGQSEYADFKAFDENMKYDEWSKTPDGQKILSDTNLTPPEGVLNIDVDMFSNPIFQIPGSAFSTIVKPIDIDSPEFKAEAEEIQASYYDIMTQKAEAETEQAKAIADNNWNIFKKNLEKKYDLQLSDNAKTAWGQLQELFSGASQKGLAGTGLEQEVKDRYMKDVRDRDQLLRESKMDEKEMENRSRLLRTGSSEEIATFAAENPDKAKEWGLVPSEEQKQWFSKENLKSLYPDMTDSEIDTISGMVIDPTTGHYRSEMYQNLYSNKYNLGEQKKSYQWEKLYQQKLDEERKAYEPYTKQNPFSSFYDKDRIPEEFKEEQVEVSQPTDALGAPTSQQTMRDAVKKYAPKIDTSLPSVPTSQQTMRDFVKKKIPSQPKTITTPKFTPPTTTSTYTPTLLDTYNKRKDVQKSFAKRFPGVNPTVMGTEANRKLNEWWSSTGQKEAADMVKKGWSGS